MSGMQHIPPAPLARLALSVPQVRVDEDHCLYSWYTLEEHAEKKDTEKQTGMVAA